MIIASYHSSTADQWWQTACKPPKAQPSHLNAVNSLFLPSYSYFPGQQATQPALRLSPHIEIQIQSHCVQHVWCNE